MPESPIPGDTPDVNSVGVDPSQVMPPPSADPSSGGSSSNEGGGGIESGIPEGMDNDTEKPGSNNGNDSKSDSSSRHRYVYSDEHFGKIGFYCALEAGRDPYPDLNVHYSQLNNRKEELRQEYSASWEEEKVKYLRQIEEDIPQKIGDLNEEIETYRASKEALIQERKSVEEALIEKKKELLAYYDKLADEELGLNGTRIEEANSELEAILNNYKGLHNTMGKGDEARDRRAMEQTLSRIQERYEAIHDKIKSLNIDGINPFVFNLLISLGYLIAIAAGWFFSNLVVYLNGQGGKTPEPLRLDSYDYFSLFLKRVLTLNTGGDNILLQLSLGILGLLVFLLLVALVAWMANSIALRFMGLTGSRVRSALDTQKKSINFQAKMQAPNFFLFWMQILPFILVIGVLMLLLILVGLDQDNNDIDKVGASAVSLAIGTTIGLASGGLLLLYITKVIEPRSAKEGGKLWRQNWELASVIILGVLSAIGLSFAEPSRAPDLVRVLVLLEFISLVLFAGFLIGYGARFKGLTQTERRLHGDYLTASMAMEEMRNPSLLRDTTEEGKKFREGLLRVNGQLLELIARRNASAIHVANEGRGPAAGSDDPVKAEKEKEAEEQARKEKGQEEHKGQVSISILGLTALKFRRPNLNGFWNQLRRTNKGTEAQPENEAIKEGIFSGIGKASKKYFAKHRQVISSLEKEVQRLEAQITDLTMEIESIRKGTALYIRERIEAIEALETARLELMDRFAHAHKDQQKKLDDLEDRFARYRYHLQDGFNLGVWFRENKIEPSPNFYGNYQA